MALSEKRWDLVFSTRIFYEHVLELSSYLGVGSKGGRKCSFYFHLFEKGVRENTGSERRESQRRGTEKRAGGVGRKKKKVFALFLQIEKHRGG